MERVIVNLKDYPKFVDEWLYSSMSIEMHLVKYGIKSAVRMPTNIKGWSMKYMMNEGDRIWFIMRWS